MALHLNDPSNNPYESGGVQQLHSESTVQNPEALSVASGEVETHSAPVQERNNALPSALMNATSTPLQNAGNQPGSSPPVTATPAVQQTAAPLQNVGNHVGASHTLSATPAIQAPAGASNPQPKEWISTWLREPIIFSAAIFTILLMLAIIALSIVSHYKQGIASVHDISISLFSYSFGIAFLWTSLPVLVFQIYNLVIMAVVTAAAVRQPYVELREERRTEHFGAAAEKSILLDYRSYLQPVAFWSAFKYNHYHLGLGFLVIFLLNIVASTFAAHLLNPTTEWLSSPIDVTATYVFNGTAFGSRSPISPVIGIVSSTLVFGGQTIPWTSADRAFVPFSFSGSLPSVQQAVERNVTASTSAYSVDLDCKILGSAEFELAEAQDKWWDYDINDRGCSVTNQRFAEPLSQWYPDFVYYKYNDDCSAASGYSRIYVVAALSPNGSQILTNKTAVSCIPTYYHETGLLTVSVGASTLDPPKIGTFIPTTRQQLSPFDPFVDVFPGQLQEPGALDFAAEVESNAFGTVIYNYVYKVFPQSYMTGPSLLNATQALYTSAFAVATTLYSIVQDEEQTVGGTLKTAETRIVVVVPVACVIVAILLITLLALLWIYLHSKRHESILYEEPKGLVGAAAILRNSELNQNMSAILASAHAGEVAKEFDRMQKAKKTGWRYLSWEDPTKARIVSTTEKTEYGFFNRKGHKKTSRLSP